MDPLTFLMLLVVVLVIQAFTGILHVKYYQKKVKKITQQYSEGYLGVGMTKKMFRVGKVAIVVTDKKGTIQECNILSGLTVLSRFAKYKEYVGENIKVIDWEKKKHRLVVQDAVKRVEEQMKREAKVS
ncbi:transcriptional regulator GutM [Oceanobacillus profundus]|uniref:transcriptional regulator GutM n=1 Tax=Oceanobacillus profundus TaxID=372463 RepID=UPI00203F6E4B|nr:transcriptional regulator GutM [Oceanobacillus profundus]MCM3400314.1 transcriptional regulator GutM [Oceanobacillus profundus]